jgi:hypothetical protein
MERRFAHMNGPESYAGETANSWYGLPCQKGKRIEAR